MADHEPAFNDFKEECILLNTAYIETRYPVHWPTNYNPETAEQAHVAAGKISRLICDQLKKQTG